MTLFPKDLSDMAAALGQELVEPSAQATAVPADDLPVDDLGRALAEGESILGDGASPEGLAWGGAADRMPGSPDTFELVAAASPGFSLGQSSGDTFGTYGTASFGLEVTVGSDSVAFDTAPMADCGCPMCNGFDPNGTGGTVGDGVDAPGPAASLQTLANYLRDGFWADFNGGDPRWYNLTNAGAGANNGTLYYNVTGFTGTRLGMSDTNGISAARQTMVRESFKLYGELMGINFVETTSDATHVDFFFIDTVYTSTGGERAFCSTELVSGTGGAIDYNVINVTPGWSGSSSNIGGTNGYTFQTFLHEIGHGMGLGHQGIYNAGSGNPTYSTDAQWVNDTWQQTIMSYWSQNNWAASGAEYAQLVSLMGADWVALNDLYASQGYGSSNAFNGNTIYGVGTNITTTVSTAMANLADYADTNAFTIVDGSGVDTVDFSNYNVAQRIDLTLSSASNTQATLSDVGGLTGNMSIAVGTIIENATTGGGNDTLTGNQYANTLRGNGGADLISGVNGNDDLYGGDGNDSVYGGGGNDTMWGEAGNDFLVADSGDDYVKGGAGADSLYGGTGVDTLIGDDDNDWIILQSGHGSFAGETHYGGNGTDWYWLYNDAAAASATFDLRDTTMGTMEAFSLSQGADMDKYLYLTGAQVASDLPTNLTISGNNYSGSTDLVYIYMSHNGTNTQAVDLSGWSLTGWQSGGDQNDRINIYGTTLADTISGSSQRDNVYGGTGNDSILGNAGDDYIDALGDNDIVYGGIGNDTILGYDGNDSLYGDEGNDSLSGENGTDRLYGGDGDDTLNGGIGTDFLYAGEGTDSLYGGDGIGYFYGGVDNTASSYFGGTSVDYFHKNSTTSGINDESYYGGDGVDWLYWDNISAGNSRVVNLATGFITFNGANRDVLSGIENVGVYSAAGIIGDANANYLFASGAYDNVIEGGAGDDTIDGGDGNDSLYAGDGVDLVFGGSGHDVLEDGTSNAPGNDTFYGGDGNDILRKASDTSASVIKVWDGGTGIDTFEDIFGNAAGAARVINLALGRMLFNGADRDIVTGIENVTVNNGSGVVGDDNANVITGVGVFSNTFAGGGGDDTIYGGGGNDALNGDAGSDWLYGGDGDDVLSVAGAEGWDSIYGGAGTDSAQFTSALNLNIDLALGVYTAGKSKIAYAIEAVEVVFASAKNDTVVGTAGDETIYGGDGRDRLYSEGGADILMGDAGGDYLYSGTGSAGAYGGADNDRIFIDDGLTSAMIADGGDGVDWLDLSLQGAAVDVNLALGTAVGSTFSITLNSIESALGSAYADEIIGNDLRNKINGGGGDDSIYGGAGADVLNGAGGDDHLEGGIGTDHLSGGIGNDTIYGGGGDDSLYGENARDLLMGDAGADLLDGGGAADTLIGGMGTDTLIGGDGGDTFLFNSAAEIGNGANSDQVLDFTSGTDMIDLSAIGGLSFIGTTAFSGSAGEVRYFALAGVGYLVGDLDGNQVADFQLLLMNGASVLAGDVIL
ncbi:M10 family metallopeptidase C-terminal domain-containing protein [Gemmobacter nectariphilus]|uniref:M10 family metallopeptidase C-terminal domain-containing protein n=1 Tax=Gemmobacter nectariphilus TaxID=220343 RepID=UPI00047FB164|nr:M10 family metallopeptidase C-terminal domain-containing protein [Gemmobacter nectariphilus]